MSFSSSVKEELSNKPPKSRHCKLAFLAGLSGEYGNTAEDLSKDCCKRAYLKGAFINSGSVNDPNKAYHFEISVPAKEQAEWLKKLIQKLGVTTRISKRRENYIVYVKDGEKISELLNLMEAHVAMMELENVRIMKEVRNSVNRQVNCDLANSYKITAAAQRQNEDIQYIIDHAGLDFLKPELAEIAKLRLENPEMSLKELGLALSEPIGKSGVNHRLAKLCEIAAGLRGQDSVAESAVNYKEEQK